MISLTAAVGVLVVALGMVLTPGPNMVYVVSRSITQGRRAGFISLLGVVTGFGCYVAATAFGLSVIFSTVPALYLTVKLAGAAYLGWLAWQALKPGGVSVFAPVAVAPDSPRRLFAMGLVTNLLNPKVAIMYAALIPQFIDVQAGHLVAQGMLLGGLQMLVSFVVNGCLVLAAGQLAGFLARRPTWLRIQRYVTGTLLGLFAVRLATDRTQPAPA